MYINPFLAGILGTIFVEIIIFIFGALLAYFDSKLDSKGEKKDGKNNNNQSDQQNQHKD